LLDSKGDRAWRSSARSRPTKRTPEVRALYDRDHETLGYVANYTKVFAHRPGVYAAWARLIGAIRSGMDKRRYELVALTAAARCFFSKTLDAVGATPDDAFHGLADRLRDVLTFGHPFGEPA